METCSTCGYPVETELQPHDDDERPGLLTCMVNGTHSPETSAVDTPKSTRFPDDPNVRCLDTIAAHMTAAGIPNVIVEMTGGGVATLCAGPTHEEEGWGTRYALMAGPGWFEPHWSAPDAHGFARIGHDFSFAPDDDGASDSEDVLGGDELAIANGFVAFIRNRTGFNPA
jgi:hypothetical protein